MRRDVREAKERAIAAWNDIAYPTLVAVGWWGPDPEIMDLESHESGLLGLMDTIGTIDKVVKPNGLLITYAVRMHHVERLGKGYRHITLRWKTASGSTTEYEKLRRVGAMKAERTIQCYVHVDQMILRSAYDVLIADVVAAVEANPYDEQEVDGGNTMLRCHEQWLFERNADVRVYSSLDECHNVNAPNVHNIIRHYGERGRAAYLSAGKFYGSGK